MIALDPNKTFWLPITDDKDGPALKCRYASVRIRDEYLELLKQGDEKNSDAPYVEALNLVVVDWRGPEQKFQVEYLRELSPPELLRAATDYLAASFVSENELKNSASASPSVAAVSVPSAKTDAK